MKEAICSSLSSSLYQKVTTAKGLFPKQLCSTWPSFSNQLSLCSIPLTLTPILQVAHINIVTVTSNLSFILNISKSNTLANLISLTLKIYTRYAYANHVHYDKSGK